MHVKYKPCAMCTSERQSSDLQTTSANLHQLVTHHSNDQNEHWLSLLTGSKTSRLRRRRDQNHYQCSMLI